MRRLTAALLIGLAVLTAILVLVPGLDLAVAGLFHRGGGEFFPADRWYIDIVYQGAPFAGRLAAGSLLALFPLSFLPRLRRHRRTIVYLWLVLALGPGLAVETFKAEVPRPRPDHVVQFGGEKTFVRVGDIDGGCRMNCAFPSAHASVGACLLAFAFLWRRRQYFWINASLAATAAIGLARMAVGAHWLSDVVFAWWIVAAVVVLLRLGMFREERRSILVRLGIGAPGETATAPGSR